MTRGIFGFYEMVRYIDLMSIHLIKLVVGVSDLSEFALWQSGHIVDFNGQRANTIMTRHKPKREEELIEGGSAYRVIKNQIVARQKILGFEYVEHPVKGRMCLIMTEPEIITVRPTAKRPFQGWRYLQPDAAPADTGVFDPKAKAPPKDMADDLAAAGLL
jgi:hypothetical protein